MTTATTNEVQRSSYKVRHAMVNWQEPGGHTLSAFRGQIVEMPVSEARRLMPHGAIVPPEMDLDRPGVLMELPQAPSDEELVNWVMQASPAEVAALAQQRQELAPRLEGAWRRIVDERKRQDDHLESIRRALAHAPQPGETGYAAPTGPTGELLTDSDIILGVPDPTATGRADGVVTLPPHQEQQPPAPPEGGGPSTGTELESIVRGSVDQVAAYLAENPEDAELVLETETRLQNGEPRPGVVKAVEVAATFRE